MKQKGVYRPARRARWRFPGLCSQNSIAGVQKQVGSALGPIPGAQTGRAAAFCGGYRSITIA